MNRTILSLSMLALGVIIGFTMSPFKGANESADDSSSSQGVLKRQLVENHPDALNNMNREISLVASGDASEAAGGSDSENQSGEGSIDPKSPDEVLLEILLAIRNEQKVLREQIAESNRDIDELTFRVDTHSDSFKPLHSINRRPRAIEVAEDAPLIEGEGTLPANP